MAVAVASTIRRMPEVLSIRRKRGVNRLRSWLLALDGARYWVLYSRRTESFLFLFPLHSFRGRILAVTFVSQVKVPKCHSYDLQCPSHSKFGMSTCSHDESSSGNFPILSFSALYVLTATTWVEHQYPKALLYSLHFPSFSLLSIHTASLNARARFILMSTQQETM